MRKFILILLGIWLSIECSVTKAGEQATQLFSHAVEAYASADYQKALGLFKQLEQQQLATKEVYFNLGNCYYKLDSIGRAIQYYEKARKHGMSGKDIEHNLLLAGTKTIDKIEPEPIFFFGRMWNSFVNVGGTNFHLTIALVLWILVLVLISLAIYVGSSSMRGFLIVSGLVLTLFTLIFIASGYSRYRHNNVLQSAVVVSNLSAVYSEPSERSTQLFMLHEGSVFDILDEEKGFLKIKLKNGKTGWLKKEHSGVI
jgi:tetratricopeptide (TPR) repeat protein